MDRAQMIELAEGEDLGDLGELIDSMDPDDLEFLDSLDEDELWEVFWHSLDESGLNEAGCPPGQRMVFGRCANVSKKGLKRRVAGAAKARRTPGAKPKLKKGPKHDPEGAKFRGALRRKKEMKKHVARHGDMIVRGELAKRVKAGDPTVGADIKRARQKAKRQAPIKAREARKKAKQARKAAAYAARRRGY